MAVCCKCTRFGRINTRRLKYTGKNILADSYTYLNNEIAPGNWRETNFVASVSQTVGEDSVEFTYTYDNCGNIVKIERDGRNYRNYEYDGLNRLTAENNYEVMRRYEWSYDDGGNITEKRVYVINGSGDDPIATIPYGYDSIWKDKLVSYNGNTGFTYDNLGNPTKYKGIDLTWTNVRRLASYGNNTFEYGADGIRFKKNNTTYILDGNRILRETDGTKTLTYYYGTNGVVGFRYNNADYFYHKNLQGDVLAIYDTNGIKQVEYEYDAWGKVLNVINCECCCCDVGNINPFRYRSYYYDVETGLYYLQTRYYDPEVGRFINSDSLRYLGYGASLSNFNLFAYCGDNPIMGCDPTGYIAWWGIALIVVAVITIKTVCTQNEIDRANSEIDAMPEPSKDISKSFEATLKNNAEIIERKKESEGIIDAGIMFYNNVKNKGPWDYKQYSEYQGTFNFYGITVQAQDIGNINFGYTGKALGLPDDVLLMGASFAQLKAGTSNFSYIIATGGDDMRDQMFIMLGIYLYNEHNS